MKSYKAILVDDELLSLTVLEEYLKDFPEIEIVEKFTKSKQALDAIVQNKPDLVFLDIQMPRLNGFELIEAFIKQHNPYIIFTTAFSEYAVKAFEVNAIGYLLKPINKEKLKHCIDKFHHYQKEENRDEWFSKIQNLIRQKDDYLDKIAIKEAKRVFFLPTDEIIYFEANGDYVKIYTLDKEYVVSESLTSFEKRLNPEKFCRIHRSYIINSKEVKEFQPFFNGEYSVVMNNNVSLKMSRHYKELWSAIFDGL